MPEASPEALPVDLPVGLPHQSPGTTGPLWRCRAAEPFQVLAWQGDNVAVVFDDRSGSTFRLNATAAALLLRLQRLGVQPASALAGHLPELCDLGLVEPVLQ